MPVKFRNNKVLLVGDGALVDPQNEVAFADPCCCRCDNGRPCSLCGDLPSGPPNRTPRYMDVRFSGVRPCLCEQCFVCGENSFKIVSSPIYSTTGTPTVRVWQTVANPCMWDGCLPGLTLKKYSGPDCSGPFEQVTAEIRVRVRKLTDLATDIIVPADEQADQKDWEVEGWAEIDGGSRTEIFLGRGAGCGCTKPSFSIDNTYLECPPSEPDSPGQPNGPCHPLVPTASAGPSHCCGSATIVPCKDACPSTLANCPECLFDAPTYISWYWNNVGNCYCPGSPAPDVPPPVITIMQTTCWPVGGTAKRIAPCVWRCVKYCGRRELCNNPTPNLCPNPAPTPNEMDGIPLIMITTITRLATVWQVEITIDGVLVFTGTSTNVGSDCKSGAFINNLIPACNPPVTTTPGGGYVQLGCDSCNCGQECRCEPECCCAYRQWYYGGSLCGLMAAGPGPATLEWSASCSNIGVVGVTPNPCDCYMYWFGPRSCNYFAAYPAMCPMIAAGTEQVMPGSYSTFIASWFRERLNHTCGIFTFKRRVAANFDPCTGRYSFAVWLSCCEDNVQDDLPSYSWSFQGEPGCAKPVSGVVPADATCCATNCAGGTSALITFSFTPPPIPEGFGPTGE